MENILITVCGRGGSKGIPGKNIKPVAGRPLLSYTAAQALKLADCLGADVVLSTDSDEIRRVGGQYGLPTEYVRPAFLADDVCGKPDAIRDAMFWAEKRYAKTYDYVIDLDVTSPIRTIDDVLASLDMIRRRPDALTVFSVNPAARNPYFSMVSQREDGFFSEVIPAKFTTRQSCPKCYDMNGSIYVYSRESLLPEHPRAVTPHSLAYVMNHICFDLDEPIDYDYLAFLMEQGKVDVQW